MIIANKDFVVCLSTKLFTKPFVEIFRWQQFVENPNLRSIVISAPDICLHHLHVWRVVGPVLDGWMGSVPAIFIVMGN